MRVLYWSELFWPHIGGLEILGGHLLPALRARGHEFAVIAGETDPLAEPRASYHDIPIHRFRFHEALLRRNLGELSAIHRQIQEIQREFRPDLIHLNLAGPSAFFHTRSRPDSIPTIVAMHGTLLPGSGNAGLQGQILRSAAWAVAVSEATLTELRRLAPVLQGSSFVIKNGLPMPLVSPSPLPTAPPHLLCLGRLAAHKGFDLALDALGLLKQRHVCARLVLAGDGDRRSALQRQAADLGLADRVQFLGWVAAEDVSTLLNSATMVLVPSRCEEGFSLVALQAAQMGRPVIASRVGGVPEVVLDGKTGLLVESEDRAALADAVAMLLHQPSLAEEMGQAARQRAREVFAFDRCVAEYDALYRRLG